MTKITTKDVGYVAKLARLRVSEKESEKFTRQLDQILKYVDKLNELDTKEVKPTSHVLSLKNVFREDKVARSLTVEKVLENAPEKLKGFFSVPKVIGEE
jgi:aspartyl-tRNA(Asn)/glutamyl-tRNA(Gln) amidotransferase subunit C